jgi:O-antigen/teichoic acid export membrane protein
MKPGLKRRLYHSVGATSLGPVSVAIIQLVTVPIFLHFWGSKLYGEWLLLSAIPMYLGLTDFGFGCVAANDMTMHVARGEKSAALDVFQSAWLLTTLVSCSVALCASLTLWLLPLDRWLNIATLSRSEVIAVLCTLGVYILLELQWTVIEAGFRCDGNYPLGTLLGAAVRFCTGIASIIAVICHGSPVAAAAALAVSRLLGNGVCRIVMRRKSPWLHYGYSHARFGVIRKLLGPALAYMAFPAGNAFSLQGMTILVGATLGPVAVVILSTTRTLTRFVYQMVVTVTNSVWVELSSAFGAGDIALARNLHRLACQASMGISVAAVLFLALFGDGIYGYWTHHRAAMDHRLFYLLLIEILANCLWFTSSVVSISCNRHVRQAMVYLLTAIISLPLAYFLVLRFGLSGVGLSLLIGDLWMIGYVLSRSLAILHDDVGAFSRALLCAPSLGTENRHIRD